MSWIFKFFENITWQEVLFTILIFLTSLAISFLAIVLVIVKLPANYFSSHYQQDFMPDSPFLVRWGAVILKNLLGVFLILLGIVLSLPGIPGQGLLTILLGLIMLDIPGKRPIEAKIISRPSILKAINDLRAKFNKPPLILD
ncbi:MAG: hypothetical protein D6687_05985 [Acidobacteria bacterium]|jgi:hypothetical protein|nr:MAG: hypothetical protein D6687_05985 [Acidobacteriota bacterium]GIU82652.1 MAG: hypothetical protein KatS3mg006_1716 [Pyrinomonadaceae bacterium]